MFRFLKKLLPFFVFILLLSVLYLFMNKEEYIKDKIRLVQIAPLSGLNKDIAIDFKKGIEAYFKYVNDNGGVKGKKIEFVSLNDRGESDIGLSLVDKIKKPFAFFGIVSPCVARRVLEIESDENSPLFMPYCSLKSFDNFKGYFSITKSIEDELKVLVNYLKQSDIKKVAIFYERNYCFNEMERKLENILKKSHINWIEKASFLPGTLFVKEAYMKLSSKSPQAVFFLSFYKAAFKFLDMAKEDENFKNTLFLAPSCIGIDALEKRANLVNLIVSNPVFPPSLNKNILKEYESIFKKYYPNDSFSIDSFKGFLYAKIFVLGAKNSPSPLSFKGILNSLKSMPYMLYNKEFLVRFVDSENKIKKIYLFSLKDNKIVPLQEE